MVCAKRWWREGGQGAGIEFKWNQSPWDWQHELWSSSTVRYQTLRYDDFKEWAEKSYKYGHTSQYLCYDKILNAYKDYDCIDGTLIWWLWCLIRINCYWRLSCLLIRQGLHKLTRGVSSSSLGPTHPQYWNIFFRKKKLGWNYDWVFRLGFILLRFAQIQLKPPFFIFGDFGVLFTATVAGRFLRW